MLLSIVLVKSLMKQFRWFLLVLLVCVKVQKIFTLSDTQFDQPDYTRLNRNATRCSSTKLGFRNDSFLHTWALHGILKYMMYMTRFNQSFEIKTEEITFKSETIDGKWIFRFSKLKPILRTKSLLSTTGNDNSTTSSHHNNILEEETVSSSSSSPMKISAVYSYEGKEPKRLNFGIFLSIVQENRDIVLPLQTSSDATVSQQRTYVTARANSPQIFTFTHSFTWPDVHEEFETMVSSSTSTGSEGGGGGGGRGDDLSLQFLITAYYPTDPLFSRGSENCQDGLLYEIYAKKILNNAPPPFVLYSTSMLNDDKYSDLFLRVGNEDFPAHRIILASTSPVFSSLIYNETFVYGPEGDNDDDDGGGDNYVRNSSSHLPPPTVIHIDDDIGGEVVSEMLRYVYTGRVNNLNELADKLIVAAERYSLPQLKKICEWIILSRISEKNAFDIYLLGTQVNSIRLSKKAFNVMRANKAKISSSSQEFYKLSTQYPRLMFELFVS